MVGIGQQSIPIPHCGPVCLNQQMVILGVVEVGAAPEALDQPQSRQGHISLRARWNGPCGVARQQLQAHWLNPVGLIGRHVVWSEQRSGGPGDRSGQLALIEASAAFFAYPLQRFGQRRPGEPTSLPGDPTLRIQLGSRALPGQQRLILSQIPRHFG